MNTSTTVIKPILAIFILAFAGCCLWAQEPPPEITTNAPPKWDASASLGFSLTSGNSDTLLLTGSLVGKRDFKNDSNLELGVSGAYGENDSIANVQSLRGWGQYDKTITKRTYWYGRLEGLHDGISEIEYRFTVSPGLGYYFIKKEKTSLKGETGPAFIYERKGGVNNGYFALRFAERFEHQFNDKVKLYQTVEYLPQIDEWSDYLVNFEVGVESALSETLSLNVFFLDNYVSQPAPGLESNDIKLVTALKYKFK